MTPNRTHHTPDRPCAICRNTIRYVGTDACVSCVLGNAVADQATASHRHIAETGEAQTIKRINGEH